MNDIMAGSGRTKAGVGDASGEVRGARHMWFVKMLASSSRAVGAAGELWGGAGGAGTEAPHFVSAGPMQSYTWSLTYTVTTAAGSPADNSQQLPCMRSTHVPSSSVTHRMPVYPHREEHG